MTPEQLDEVEALWDTGCLVMAGSYTPQLVKALREESAARDRAEAACFRLEVERNESRDRATLAERLLRETCDALQNSVVGRFAIAGELYTQALPRVDAALNDARAEVERLKEHLRHIAYEHCDSPVHYAMNHLEDQ